ncbi:MAG TPA: putative glycoside hydrolase [Thermomicrobiales bacterium]|nr:putative glycoside hydrolase [Thermomicrobiales bacterium]
MIPERTPFGRRQRRWDRISWWYSLLFALPLIGLIVTLAVSAGDDDSLTGVVLDAYTGSPVSGAIVSTAHATATTNGSGEFSITDLTATTLAVSREAYESTEVAVTDDAESIEVSLRPTTVSGIVTHRRTLEPLSGIEVRAEGPNGESFTTMTDDDGRYTLDDIPAGATISVHYEGFTVASRLIGEDVDLDFEIRPDVLSGRVTDQAGVPLEGASVAIGEAIVTTEPDGTFRLGAVPESGVITVKKAGYRDLSGELPESLVFNAQLEEFRVKAIYVTANTAALDYRWEEMLAVVESTEVNAIVLDLKDSVGLVYYDTNVVMAHEIGAVSPILDIEQRLGDMQERGIYTIARIVVFEDPLLAQARPDLAIHDTATGGLWKTWNGLAWVNAHEREVWHYNIALAVEAANLGFDEIQLDYIRFPSDGMLELADYGPEYADSTRLDAITGFLAEMQQALAPTGALLAVDIFGITMWEEDDGGIGQNFAAIAPFVDVVCPMIYPSHFYPGAIGLDIPNNHPYEVIYTSLMSGAAMVPEAREKLRPWLQDFSYGEGIEYGDIEVLAQIRAADDFGANGWMIWNPGNEYRLGSFNGS